MIRATFLSILLCACGGGGSSDADADADTDADSDSDTGTGSDTGPCLLSHVTHTSGRVVDVGGQPIEGATVGFCMRNDVTQVCLAPIPTDSDGRYEIEIPEDFQCLYHAVDRLYFEGMAVGYCELPVDGVDGPLESPDFTLFPLSGPAPDWGPGEDDEITYVAEDGGEVTLRRSDVVVHAVETDLRMTAIDPTVQRPCFLPEGQEPAALYAMGPETSVSREGGLPARLLDKTGLPEGTPVDLYTLGSLVSAFGDEPVVEGVWQVFAESTVDAEGYIATPDGDGLPQLGWIGAVAQ